MTTKLTEKRIHSEIVAAVSKVGGLFVPLTLAASGFFLDVVLEERRAKVEFQAKVAEIVVSSDTPYEAHGRALAFKALFPDRLPSDFAEQFDPELLDQGATPEDELTVSAKKELIHLIAENPDQLQLVLALWSVLLPDDEWARHLKATLGL